MSAWVSEVWRFVILLIVSATIGYFYDQILVACLAFLAVYLGWHVLNIYRLAKWLERPGKFNLPRGRGIWAEIYNQNYRIQRKNRDQKKKLTNYINRFKESTAAMPDATVVLNRNNQIEWINKAAQDMLGLHPTQDICRHIITLITNQQLADYLDAKDFSMPLEICLSEDPELCVSIRIIPYGKHQHLFIARDITRLKRLEQMRRDFVSNISHELRTPLTVIHGYLESMEDETEEALLEWQPHIRLMIRQSSRMQNIVNDLLTLSRLENEAIPADHLSEVSVPALLETIREEAEVLSENLDKNLEIVLEVDNKMWLEGVHNELYSAFSNLIFNAVRYTPKGGRVSIRWYKKGQMAHFEVEDNGPGIPPDLIPRLTERFFRVDVGRSREVGGTGLGLAIVKYIFERHQSRLDIRSVVDHGSTFACDFPADRIKMRPQQIVT